MCRNFAPHAMRGLTVTQDRRSWPIASGRQEWGMLWYTGFIQ